MTQETTGAPLADTAETLMATSDEVTKWMRDHLNTFAVGIAERIAPFVKRVQDAPISDALKVSILNMTLKAMEEAGNGISAAFEEAMA